MGQIKGVKYGYNDINIVPEVQTVIMSRREVNPYDKNGFAPLIASPMDSVVSMENYKTFNDNMIYAVIPRTYSFEERCEILKNESRNPGIFVSFSLDEANTLLLRPTLNTSALLVRQEMKKDWSFYIRICIDLANGHMGYLLSLIKQIKSQYGKQVIVMSGNIANPETYRKYENAGCDFVRVSIGTGEGCSTSTNTGIHYPIFSLLNEMYEIKKELNGKCKIIADGGIKSYGDIQKALIYADYVMIGGLFSKMIESAGEKYYGKSYWNIRGMKILRPLKTFFTYGKKVKKINLEKWKDGKVKYFKIFKGMSTKEAQLKIHNANGEEKSIVLKPSEGFVKKLYIENTLNDWINNEKAYLRSMMSYIGAKNLEECKDALWVAKQSKNHN